MVFIEGATVCHSLTVNSPNKILNFPQPFFHENKI